MNGFYDVNYGLAKKIYDRIPARQILSENRITPECICEDVAAKCLR